jgi:signal transduction histidine kinase
MMDDPRLVPLYIFGTLLIAVFTIAVTISMLILKHRQVNNRLARQQQAFDYSQSLLHTRIEVQESTLNMIAQELHDNIAQSLTGCFMQVATAASLVQDNDSLKEIIGEAKNGIDKVVSDVRLLSHSLATGMAEHRDLSEAIQAELTRIASFSNNSCTLRSRTIHELQPDQRLLIFRVFQEALQNILKHAHASSILIELDSDDAAYKMSITDNGRGFDVATISHAGSFGLMNIKERIALLSGTLHIVSAPGQGTQIHVTVPINLPNGADKNCNS